VLGVEPVLVDDRPSGPVDGRQVLRTDRGGLEALAACDVVVKSPGISRYRPEVARLVGAGVAVTGGLALWLEEVDPERVLLVTGTKGKSTTAALAGHLLVALGHRAEVTGNIGRPPFDPEAPTGDGFQVVEVSSFQATDLASAPPVVVVTSLAPDHLDWHGDAETYFADKLSVCRRPGARVTVADATSPPLVARRALLGPEVAWVDGAGVDGTGDPVAAAVPLAGVHNRRNAALARAALVARGVAEAGDDQAVTAALASFEGLPHRLHEVGGADGVTFVDDSLSTNVLPTLAALDAYAGRRVALLLGGHDRGIDYRPLGRALAHREVPALALTLPDNGPRIARALAESGVPGALVRPSENLEEAVAAGFEWARPGGVVLLSPAAPSFGRYADYAARGDAFARAAAEVALAGGGGRTLSRGGAPPG
jgi:UDP-N-acetylmuramoylalanine--D-glutamate ligase